MSNDTEKNIFTNYISDDISCAQSVIDHYYWIAEYVVSKFTKLGSSRELLEDVAYEALLDSAAEFSQSSGVRFGKFAVETIRERVYCAVMDDAVLNHRASVVTNALIRLKSAASTVGNNITNDSTDWKASQALGIDENALADIIYGPAPVSREELSDISKQGIEKLKKTPSHLSRQFFKSASKSFNDLIESFCDNE